MHLLELPIEILTHIFDNLYFIDLYTCLRLNHTLQALINNSVRLQYKISCGEAGVLDNPSCHLPIANRLSILRNREHSWRHFQYEYCVSIEVPYRSSGIYDVTPSSYILGCAAANDPFTAVALQAVVFPTGAKHGSQPDWREINAAKNLVDFGTCLEEHDLIALVTLTPDPQDVVNNLLEITLRRFSTGTLHEDAEREVLQVCTVNGSTPPPMISIEIVGENLALIVIHPMDVGTSGALLHIFNWKKGTKKCEALSVFNGGLVFLREDLLVNPDVNRGALQIYHIPHSSSSEHVQLVQSLGLPALSSSQFITNIACRSDPNPTALPGITHISSARAFSNKPDDAIIILTLDIQSFEDHRISSFAMIVHRWAIIKHITLPNLGQSTTMLFWETWGPPVTRWFNTDGEMNGLITLTSGQRYVQIGAEAREVPSHIRLLDFNPCNVRRMQHNQGRGRQAHIQVVGLGGDEEDNVCSVDGVFMEDIKSALPYVSCTSTGMFDYDAVLIDEERLLGLQSPPRSPVVETIEVIYFG